jgi:high-affinity iron transporter
MEASLIVAIILSYLRKTGRHEQARAVWVGIMAALVVDGAAGTVIWMSIHRYSGTALQTEFEGSTYFLAAGILTAMSFWMKAQGRHLKIQLQSDIDRSLATSSRWAGDYGVCASPGFSAESANRHQRRNPGSGHRAGD